MGKIKSIFGAAAIVVLAVVLVITFTQSNLNNVEKDDIILKSSEPLSPLIQSPNDSNVFFLNTENIPEKDGYVFLGYSALADASRLDYVYDKESNTFSPESVTINAPTDGTSTSTLTLFVVWQVVDTRTLADITYLQEANSGICERSTLDQQYTLTDKRDNKTYTVAKLKMNPEGTETTCWMTQNLALELSTEKTLTSDDTDLNDVESWTPNKSISYSENDSFSWSKQGGTTAESFYRPSTIATVGVYYNGAAALAINGVDNLPPLTQYQNAPNSICPKGWRLPKIYDGTESNDTNEFSNLLTSYGIPFDITESDYNKAKATPLLFVESGHIESGNIMDINAVNLWSATLRDYIPDFYMLLLGYRGDTLQFTTIDYLPADYGLPMRCILR